MWVWALSALRTCARNPEKPNKVALSAIKTFKTSELLQQGQESPPPQAPAACAEAEDVWFEEKERFSQFDQTEAIELMMEQQEQREWDAVNRLLQHHGFKPVTFADPTENKNLAELVLLEHKSASEIRKMLKTMLSDSERRQGLIQELIQSNSQLKEEVQQHQERAARHSQRAGELEGVLEGVKVKIQDLEDSYIAKAAQQQSRFNQLQQEKRDAEHVNRYPYPCVVDTQKRCVSAEHQLALEQQQVSGLQKKLQEAERQEERRLSRQKQMLQQIQSRPPLFLGSVSRARFNLKATLWMFFHRRILDVIDVYEMEMQQLQNELKRYRGEDSSNSQNSRPRAEKDASGSFSTSKALLKSYQEQLKEAKAHREELRAEIQQLKEELESRPSVKELKTCKQQLKRLDRILQQSNLRFSQAAKAQDVDESEAVEGGSLRNMGSSRVLALLHDICAVLTKHKAPLRQHVHPQLLQEAGFQRILPTLEVWSQQLSSLTGLQRSLVKLQKQLLPWQPDTGISAPQESPRVEDLMLMMDTLLDETTPDDEVLRNPTRHALMAMVMHFQKLFDVPSLAGVYPRMNDVYSRLGEMNNAMRNLRDLLHLDGRAPPSEVVNKVALVVSQSGNVSGQELCALLESTDIDSIIVKLKEHEEFFPVFHSFILELLRTLGVTTLDDILPTIHSLKGGY
ncbi:hypothetical protein DNTS_034754 [Danionella cerebrum]|uniref:Centrosomal protein of 70 kDa n=1 Tax=Danionella cerebrum TaxID=2873325 RepID=A0A553RF18_9TELE|nr:hypothetical protein DNTS_034754 [Danionella translucida]